MARTLTELRAIYNAEYISQRAIAAMPFDDPQQWSLYNIKRLQREIAIYMQLLQDELIDAHEERVNDTLRRKNPPTIGWYEDLCLNFQSGFPLIPGTRYFDNTGYTEQDIEESKQIKYAKVRKQENEYMRVSLRVLIAGFDGTNLTQLNDVVVANVYNYFMNLNVAAAGEHMRIESLPPDSLKNKWLIEYDPLILNSAGQRIDGTDNTPCEKAIKNFLLTGMQFGGLYDVVFHTDAVQKVPGVKVPRLLQASATYAQLPYTSITDTYLADAGYLRFINDYDLEITYKAWG